MAHVSSQAFKSLYVLICMSHHSNCRVPFALGDWEGRWGGREESFSRMSASVSIAGVNWYALFCL